MKRTSGCLRFVLAAGLLPLVLVEQGFAWGHDGHTMINQVAAAALPDDVPAFLRSKAAIDAVGFYGPVPDSRQWRSSAVPELGYARAPEHFMDMEYADLLGHPLPAKRYDYYHDLAAAQAGHPDVKMTPENVGTLPYAAEEYYEELRAAMHDYREVVAAKEDTKPVEAEIVYVVGILGHWIADGSQPLHATIQYNGWNGPNPNGYTTSHKVHTVFEGDYVHDNIKATDFAGLVAKPAVVAEVFPEIMTYLHKSNSMVEKLYQLEKAGAFNGTGTPAGKTFVDERLAAGAQELRDMVYTAWVRSGDPVKPYTGN
jgi:hypothetical protein